mmetsp:Transcript_13510/g.24843  ORF Transcript_13510/g.24843 Transcript_13510/m.24843 type:complete len:207 (+) Transcript_13510:717-1337(+)
MPCPHCSHQCSPARLSALLVHVCPSILPLVVAFYVYLVLVVTWLTQCLTQLQPSFSRSQHKQCTAISPCHACLKLSLGMERLSHCTAANGCDQSIAITNVLKLHGATTARPQRSHCGCTKKMQPWSIQTYQSDLTKWERVQVARQSKSVLLGRHVHPLRRHLHGHCIHSQQVQQSWVAQCCAANVGSKDYVVQQEAHLPRAIQLHS